MSNIFLISLPEITAICNGRVISSAELSTVKIIDVSASFRRMCYFCSIRSFLGLGNLEKFSGYKHIFADLVLLMMKQKL